MKITFRKLKIGDLQLLHKWLNEGPVLEWYSKKPSTFEEVKEKYTPRIEGKTKTDHYVTLYGGQPIGYVQTYRVTDYPEWNQYVGAKEDTAGLDLFIGENEFRGKGLGSQVIREFLQQIVFKDPSITTCVSGPDPKNGASKRAFEKAGFKYFKTIQPPEGEEYLMKVDRNNVPFIYFLTGASGVGKTTLLDQLVKKYGDRSDWVFLHFDSIGVPSVEEMIKQYGSPAGWQEAMTYKWIDKIMMEHADKEVVVLEGQVNLDFIKKGFEKHKFQNYQAILVDCDEEEMAFRLTHKRSQPELLNEDMRNWLKFLRKQAQEQDVSIIDTSHLSPEEVLASFESKIL